MLGGVSQFTLAGGSTTWLLVPSVVLLLAAYGVGTATLVTLPSRARRPLLALALAVGGTTVALYAKYKFGDDYGYGAYKALVSGGALLAGLLTVTLAGEGADAPGTRPPPACAWRSGCRSPPDPPDPAQRRPRASARRTAR